MKHKIKIYFSLNKIEIIVDSLVERNRIVDDIRSTTSDWISIPELKNTTINIRNIDKVTWDWIDE